MLKIRWKEKMKETQKRDELARRVQETMAENKMLKEEISKLQSCIFDSFQEQEVPDCMVNARKLIKVIRQMKGMLITGFRVLSYDGAVYFLEELEKQVFEEACKKGETENE